jgi:hypothetical protein
MSSSLVVPPVVLYVVVLAGAVHAVGELEQAVDDPGGDHSRAVCPDFLIAQPIKFLIWIKNFHLLEA